VNRAEDVKAQTDIVNLIGQTVKLKKRGDEYFGLCPFHNDTTASLTVNSEKQAWYCHSCLIGGDCFAWVQTLQKVSFPEALQSLSTAMSPIERHIVATFDYVDTQGTLLYQVVRYEPKSFSQRKPDGKGGWIWNLDGVKRILYHLPDILKADKVHLTEGEKDCDALWGLGLVATTSPGGAGNWKAEYADYLKDKKVTIIPDKDPAGFEYAKQATRSLQGKAKEVKVIILPGEKVKDFTDWLDLGGWVEELDQLEQDVSVLFQSDQPNYQYEGETISWQLDNGMHFIASDIRQERTGVHAKLEIHAEGEALSWSVCNIDKNEDRVRLANAAHSQMGKALAEVCSKEMLRTDLDKFCLGLWNNYLSHFMPEMVAGSEDNQQLRFLLRPYVIEGGGTILFAPPGRGKSYTALLWAVSIDAGVSSFWQTSQVPTLFINLERSGQSLRRRLAAVNRILGLDPKCPLLILNARGK